MAKAKKSGGEGKLGLIIALAFFVLTSIALGVFAYQFNSEIEGAKNAEKKEKDAAAAATKIIETERKRVALYKMAAGAELTADDKTVLAGTPSTDPLRAEHQAFMDKVKANFKAVVAAEGKAVPGGLAFDADKVVVWDWPDGKTLGEPKSGLQPNRATTFLNEAVKYVAAAEATRAQANRAKADAAAANDNATKEQADAGKAKGDLEKATGEAVAEKAKVVAAVDGAKKAAAEAYNADVAQFGKEKADANKKANQAIQEKELLKQEVAEKTEQLSVVKAKADKKNAQLPFDKPKGKIVSRKGNTVEINLGRADGLLEGTTFNVQPVDFPERGQRSRDMPLLNMRSKQPVKDETTGDPLVISTPKGTLTVNDILGDHLARAVIDGEADDIREPIMADDLLYNAAWEKGVKQHVVLVGIFDRDANGSDDIKQVAAELNKANVIVDGYYDPASRKWEIGGPTARTAFVIVGEFPNVRADAGGAERLKEWGTLITSLNGAIAEAEKAGAEKIRYYNFFPRIGYKVAYGLSDETINEAAAKYLQPALAAPAPEMPPKQ